MSMNLDGTDRKYVGRGIRNTVGFEWDNENNDLWFTDNGRDHLGDDTPPDELNHAPREGLHFGYPHCHGKNISDPHFNQGKNCSQFTPATYELGPHVAALGLTFYTGNEFPNQFKNQIMIAEHGSWNRKVPIGYRISWVNKKDRSPSSYKIFIDGWLQLSENKDENAWGRPGDVINYKNGILISDDKAGAIYRVSKK